jgi:hypothetical protein
MKNFLGFIGGIVAIIVIALIVTFPATWLLMLFLGNVGLGLSYWGTLPLGIIVSLLIGAGGSSDTLNVFNVFTDD